MINKKCWSENEVRNRELTVPINSIFWKIAITGMYNCFEKIGVSEKGVLSKISNSEVLSVAN